MIKAKGTMKDGRPMFVFGLSERNLELLREGRPMQINLDGMGGSGEVVITYGQTERDLVNLLSDLIGPGTVVRGMQGFHQD